MLYKQDLAKLKHGKWLGNSIIDFFIWKLLDMLIKLGMKDVYKRFKVMESGFMHYMFFQFDHYDFDACRRWVTKREVNPDVHVFWFMSNELIFVPVNMENVQWVLFVICPANREIFVVDSLYDPRSQYHVNIYHNLVPFIQDYQKTKSLPQDGCGI
jgi:Ulp1 family protease